MAKEKVKTPPNIAPIIKIGVTMDSEMLEINDKTTPVTQNTPLIIAN